METVSIWYISKIIGEKGNIEWDFEFHQVKMFLEEKKEWVTCLTQPEFDINDMYVKEIKYFLDCKSKRVQPFNNISETMGVLRWAISMREQFYQERERKVA